MWVCNPDKHKNESNNIDEASCDTPDVETMNAEGTERKEKKECWQDALV